MSIHTFTQQLAKTIRQSGPITVADFMEAALGDEKFGYYMTRDPFGTRGDFTTAPEISQMFGELIGLWCASLWMQLGSPPLIQLAELGPGRGTLMADILRAAKSVPGFSQSLNIHLIEMSPHLQSIQRKTLGKSRHTINWHSHIDSLPPGPVIVIANEFFDALPIRQFIKTPQGWCERLVSINANDQYEFTISDQPVTSSGVNIPLQLADAPIDSLIETCAPAENITTSLTTRIKTQGGGALFIDYGYTTPATGETLQAVSAHKFADVLQNPGEQDLTAHVNFASLATAAQNAGGTTFGPLTQAELLFGLGLEARANTLMKASTASQALGIKNAATRLTSTDQMGTLFKALAITQDAATIPAPFT